MQSERVRDSNIITSSSNATRIFLSMDGKYWRPTMWQTWYFSTAKFFTLATRCFFFCFVFPTTLFFVTTSMMSSTHVPLNSQHCLCALRANNWQKNSKQGWTDLDVNNEFTPCHLLCSRLCAGLTNQITGKKKAQTDKVWYWRILRVCFILIEHEAEMSPNT